MQQQQSQYQGDERRQSQTQYQGADRRRSVPPGMTLQARKEQQEERAREQQAKHRDQH